MPKIILTKNQWSRLADILGNLGLVFFASVVLPYILDKPETWIVIWGSILTIISWYGSMAAEKRAK